MWINGVGINKFMSINTLQLTLPVNIKEGLSFENFLESADSPLIDTLKKQWSTDGQTFIYLCGALGSGCSHLLQAACDYAFKKGHQSLYLPLDLLIHESADILLELEKYPLLAIDNIERLKGNLDWQRAVLDLYHRVQAREGLLLMASSVSSTQLNLELKDLDSRIRSGLVLRVNKLDDQDKQRALILRAKSQGLIIEPKVANYILVHSLRDMHQLQELIDALGAASLAQKRLITIPFVKSVLESIKKTNQPDSSF